ncbi:hypothetical protein TL16_g07843 [Triparma laevis f. inornata]|uniref:Uncharacterized protein n=1 Tax=Triparma laevis f. inornata TaxID=1714386 RepID=A0A9W7EH44_9STRA|nr:hypothetical protein TL16_g07843 [Triparma laevis f. inornata]
MASKSGLDSKTSTKGFKKKKKKKKVGSQADKLFFEIGALLYDRFRKEAVIDERRKEVRQHEERRGWGGARKRVKGFVILTIDVVFVRLWCSLQNFIKNIDIAPASAVTLFAELWLLDTYAEKAELKDAKISEVWNDLNGTRGLQYTTSVALLGGFQDRVGATSQGVHIIKELTEDTCEWTKAQQADLKFSSVMRVSVLDMVAKQQMGYTNEVQEKFRRNGKEVDMDRVAALAGDILQF